MHETVPATRRVYMVIEPGAEGCMQMRLSFKPPSYQDPIAVFLLKGMLPSDSDITLDLVSDPTANPALIGQPGASAYQIARGLGYGGTATQWLASLRGADGMSAYEVARAAGFTGTAAQWLASLKGKDASAYLGTVTIAQTATVAIAAGVRRLTIAVPAGMGLATGDSIMLAPTKMIDGYAIHDAVAVSATSINVGISGPLLAIGSAMPSIPCKLFRFNT